MEGFEQLGFSILSGVFDVAKIDRLIDSISTIEGDRAVRSRGGVYAIRNLLQLSPAVSELANSAKVRRMADEGLRGSAFPVRAMLFDKTAGANWLVPWHQDLTICVKARVDVPSYGPWTKKAGVWHVQPPASVLERMLSVRIHLDDCGESNGALRVIPGSHKFGRLSAAEISAQQQGMPVTCVVDAGGVLLMRPLLLHASSAAVASKHRRVIHIDYACGELDGGLRWIG